MVGKSKVYFLKKSLSARKSAYDAENYKMIKLIRNYPYLEPLIKDILTIKTSHLIVLFGSYAKFTAKRDSDIDLYVETDKISLRDEIENKNSKLSVKIGLFNPNDLLIKEIIKNHVIIKGVDEFYERTKFFD
ncbi:MAG: nucleotidyltransferase domain-containing protein [DPANN group archaeon]|nr:nucleotidyltransferase domain-containing protein [DPANN group archaeon]